MNEHEQLVDRAARHAHTVLFLGGMDAGKSTIARATAAFALRLGRSVAYIDADVAQKTIGPPTTVGMKHIRSADDLTLEALSARRRPRVRRLDPAAGRPGRADRRPPAAARSSTERGSRPADRRHGRRDRRDRRRAAQVLHGRRARARPRGRARSAARSSSRSSGSSIASSGSRPMSAPVHPDVVADERRGADGRAREGDGGYFDAGEQQRFRIKPTVFVPTLPPLYDLADARPHARRAVRRAPAGSSGSGCSATCRRTAGCASRPRWQSRPKPLDWAPFVWRTPTARSGWTSGASSEPNERRDRVPSLVKKRRKKMRKKKHKKLLKRTRHQRMKLGK